MKEDEPNMLELDSDLKMYLLKHVEFEQLVFLAYVAQVEFQYNKKENACIATEAIKLIKETMKEKNPGSKKSFISTEEDFANLREQSIASSSSLLWIIAQNILHK